MIPNQEINLDLRHLMRHTAEALHWAGSQSADRVKQRMSRPWPPSSKISEPPARRTGDLVEGVSVSEPVVSGNTAEVEVFVLRNGSDEIPYILAEVLHRDLLATEIAYLRSGVLAGDVGDWLAVQLRPN